MAEPSDRKVGLVALGIVFGGGLTLAVLNSGTRGIASVGAFAAVGLLIVSVLEFRKPVVAWLAGMSAAALLVATAATLIGGEVCASDNLTNLGQCRADGHGTATTVDNDWHGWPIPWRTDLSSNHQRRSHVDVTTTDPWGANGIAVPFLIISLGAWFTASFVAEGAVIAAWRAVRRVCVHGTLFPAT